MQSNCTRRILSDSRSHSDIETNTQEIRSITISVKCLSVTFLQAHTSSECAWVHTNHKSRIKMLRYSNQTRKHKYYHSECATSCYEYIPCRLDFYNKKQKKIQTYWKTPQPATSVINAYRSRGCMVLANHKPGEKTTRRETLLTVARVGSDVISTGSYQ